MTAYGYPPEPEPCDGCDREAVRGEDDGELRTRWLASPYGLTAVHVHDDPVCASRARIKRGGGRFVPEPITPAERLARQQEKGEAT